MHCGKVKSFEGPAEEVKQESLDESDDITIQTEIGNAKVESNDNS